MHRPRCNCPMRNFLRCSAHECRTRDETNSYGCPFLVCHCGHCICGSSIWQMDTAPAAGACSYKRRTDYILGSGANELRSSWSLDPMAFHPIRLIQVLCNEPKD